MGASKPQLASNICRVTARSTLRKQYEYTELQLVLGGTYYLSQLARSIGLPVQLRRRGGASLENPRELLILDVPHIQVIIIYYHIISNLSPTASDIALT